MRQQQRMSVEEDAIEDAKQEAKQFESQIQTARDQMLTHRTRRFVNETDFETSPYDKNAPGEHNFKQFMN